MTNQEAINTTKKFIADLEACDIPIYADEKEALEKIIEMAEKYNEEHLRNVNWKILDGGGHNTKKTTPNESGRGNQAKTILIDEIDLGN